MICGRAALALTAWDDSKFCGRALLATALPFPVPALNYMPVYPWQQVYKAAVLERDPARLEEFVQSAFTVIYEHLRARGDITAEESEALLDALHALERLQKSKPGQSRRAAC